MKQRPLLSLAVLCACASFVPAQDSVSKSGGLPGDAVDPWADASASIGTEQRNDYVVDLVPLTTSWKTRFGIAPAIKSSKSNSNYFNSLISAQGISRTQLRNRRIVQQYRSWNQPGGGVHNQAAVNDPGTPAIGVPLGNQFAVAFAELGTTDAQAEHSGIITGLVNFDPAVPGRLFIRRYVAALGGCNSASELSSFGFGAVDAEGNAVFRADGYGMNGKNCGGTLNALTGDNIFVVASAARDEKIQNVINGNALAGYDATNWIVSYSTTTHSIPAIAAVNGPFYVGPNFNGEYVRGAGSTTVKADKTHFASGVVDQRGGMSYLAQNHPWFQSTNGLVAHLGQNSSQQTVAMNVFGLDAKGDPTKAFAFVPPANVTDPITNEQNIPGNNAFDHYHSQVAYRGGSGQVAVNVDGSGNLLVAACMDHPSDGGATWGQHFIPVARMDPSGNVTWTMAAYNNSRSSKSKPILDGPGGKAIGQLTTLDKATNNLRNGPSFSSPMLDSAGNVWFVSAIELFGSPNSTYTVGLIRAVYDATKFGYQLELVLKQGDVFKGANSNTEYRIDYITLVDSNSIDSGAPFSQNISEQGHGGFEYPLEPTSSPIHLGGLVLNVTVLYDYNGDKKFESPAGTGGNPNSPDQEYEVLLYLGALESTQLDQDAQGPGDSILTVHGEGLGANETSTVTLTGAPANQPSVFIVTFTGGQDVPFGGGTLLSLTNLYLALPVVTSPQGTVRFNLPGLPNVVSTIFQFATLDLPAPTQWSISNGVLARFGL